jgi:hypothetical protein
VVIMSDGVSSFAVMDGGTSGIAAVGDAVTDCACAAAASGPPSICGGARLRRRTNPARRPLGAAVVVDGVGRRWPLAVLVGPSPRADAGGGISGRCQVADAETCSSCGNQATVDTELGGKSGRPSTTRVRDVTHTVKGTITAGTCAAAACGKRTQGEGALLCRRTYFAMRPPRAAVTRAGVGRTWPRELVGEPVPWAGGAHVEIMTTRSARRARSPGLDSEGIDGGRHKFFLTEVIQAAADVGHARSGRALEVDANAAAGGLAGGCMGTRLCS